MLNLLLRKDRYNLRKEYTLRFFNIIFIFGILASVIFMVLLFSISIFVWVENNIISSQLDAVVGSGNTEQREDLEKMTEDINRQIKELQKVRPEYSGFLSEILSVQPQGVGLESINFQPNFSEEDPHIKIKINAQAGLRNNMIAYADGLRNIDYFSDVDLPLSNLTRGTNIMFEITLRTKSLVYEELENLDNGNDDE